MPRKPDKRIREAKEMFLKGARLVDISAKLNVPEGTVRRWKSTHKWDSERSDRESERSDKKRGGQPGNKNAEGHGGTGPPGNKNAVKTGEFETLFFDTLDEEEKELITAIQPDKEELLLREIQLLAIRERRMLKRIEMLRNLEEAERNSGCSDDVPPGMSVVKYTSGIEKGKHTELREYEGVLGQIQAVEDALTRVQARQQKAIELLHKFGYDDARVELESMKFEIKLRKQEGSQEEQEDDGFLEAMNAVAEDVWSEEDE